MQSMFDHRDRKYMKKALALAEKAIGLASPNPSVGCLIVKGEEVVGTGWHEYEELDHAEVRALRQAGDRSRNATAYVTLEPCSHHGRTPPCADKLIQAGISRVVVARIDPNPLVSGRGIERLRSVGIQVDVGLMAEKSGKILEPFACRITTGLPLVIAKIGMSLDGKAGGGQRESRWITSQEGREFAQSIRLRVDALLVGIGTVLADNPELTYRGSTPKARPLMRVVLDPNLRIPSDARLLQDPSKGPVLLFCGKEAPEERRRELQGKGAEIVDAPIMEGELDLEFVLNELAKRKVLALLVEGGGQTHWSFLAHRMVDVFYFIIAPLILGGTDAIPSVAGKGYGAAEHSPRFKIRGCFSVGPDLVLECYPSYSRSIISPWLSQETSAFDRQDSSRSSERK
jgi:diaminohydroxyphosphoribosylaminopyrimidine deaminase / 5-amino-6-(5-phosphoribosylamino)uracil reductase